MFGDGQYAPGTVTGKRLLAHELAHVVQQHQPAGPIADSGLVPDGGNDAFEQEAGWTARVISAGRPVHLVARGVGPLLQRQRVGADQKGPPPERQLLPSWTPAQLGYIQAQLKRLGLYQGHIDRRFGQDTEAGLVEAFGSDDWRKPIQPRSSGGFVRPHRRRGNQGSTTCGMANCSRTAFLI